MPLALTPLMKKRLTRRAQAMIERSLTCFPELAGKTITVGYTRAHLGSASLIYGAASQPRLIVRLKIRNLTYQTIGHELTHLVQGLARGDRRLRAAVSSEKIPCGEKQCDIWTLARDDLFCDDPPTYLRLPRILREQWQSYAESVRALCIAAIDKRSTHRRYIQWLENEIRALSVTRPAKNPEPEQLWLSLGGKRR
jgi:hypothetical protein